MGMNDPMKNYYKSAFDKIEVPEHLLDKTLAAAFRSEQSENQHLSGSRRLRPAIIVAMIAVAVLGAAVVYASVTGLWSRGLTGMVHSDPDAQQELIDRGYAFPLAEKYQELAVTCSGVTITPNMILTDGKIAYVSFLIEGYDYEIGKEEHPGFISNSKDFPLLDIRDGNNPEKYIHTARTESHGFYSDVTVSKEGMPCYSDGTPAAINPDGSVVGRYRDENGNLEYIVKIMTTEGTPFYEAPYGMNPELSATLYGSILHIEFKDLGTTDPTFDREKAIESEINESSGGTWDPEQEYKNIVYGTWTFDITMPDEKEASGLIRTVDLNKQLEDTDCFIETVEISPISVKLIYTVSRLKNKRGGDNTFELHGIRMKDGTTIVENTTWNYPLVLYGDSEEKRTELFSLDHVVDPEQVESLLVCRFAYSEEIEIRIQD